jgi:ubiquinone/menaquinone biosynthesis C-methylase UbiE
MSITSPAIFDRMSALADTTRSRLLLLLERHELTVGELCQVLQLPQSTVSRHLKLLGDEGWVSGRAEGTSRRYHMPAAQMDAGARQLWQLVRDEVAALPGAAQDGDRLRSVLSQRSTRSREFFSSAAGEWDRLRAELFGRRADLLALLGLLDEAWTVGDLGCGTGQVTQSLAPFVTRVVAVDSSPAMLDAARARLGGLPNVETREGELESLPIRDGELDAAIAFLVLHYVAEPGEALAEAARALKPGGRLLVVDMMPHDRDEYRQAMGHVWQGFEVERMERWMREAGMTSYRYVPLPADPAAKGPTLFAASARRSA